MRKISVILISAALSLLLCACLKGEVLFSPDTVQPLSDSDIIRMNESAEIVYDDGGIMRSISCGGGLDGTEVTSKRSAIEFVHSVSTQLGISDTPSQLRLDSRYKSADGQSELYVFIRSCSGVPVLDSFVMLEQSGGEVTRLTSTFIPELEPLREKARISVTQAFVSAEEQLSLSVGERTIGSPLLAYFTGDDGILRLVYSFEIYSGGEFAYYCISDAATGELLYTDSENSRYFAVPSGWERIE